MMNSDLAFVVMLSGILGIYAGLCGRILIGVAGGVFAMVGLASLLHGRPHLWVVLTVGVPFCAITIFLLRTARRARRNKAQ
jgi:hypothetical protein